MQPQSVSLIESYEPRYGITHCYVGIEIITLTFAGPGLYDCRTHMTIDHVKIFDTTLRDGEQSPGCSMNLAEKVRLARKLQELGVDIIEAGFPIASDGDFAAVEAVARECRDVTVAALCRTSEQDVRAAGEAL